MDKAKTGEDSIDLIAVLRQECVDLHEATRLERIEAQAWMREMIAAKIERIEVTLTVEELAAEIRAVPTEPPEEPE